MLHFSACFCLVIAQTFELGVYITKSNATARINAKALLYVVLNHAIIGARLSLNKVLWQRANSTTHLLGFFHNYLPN